MTAPETNSRDAHAILIVDDDETFSMLLALWLRSEGWTVAIAPTDTAARDHVAQNPSLSIVLCDFELSANHTGPAIMRDLREIRPELQCIFVSGHQEEFVRRDPEMVDAQFLQKPFEPEALNHKLKLLLQP